MKKTIGVSCVLGVCAALFYLLISVGFAGFGAATSHDIVLGVTVFVLATFLMLAGQLLAGYYRRVIAGTLKKSSKIYAELLRLNEKYTSEFYELDRFKLFTFYCTSLSEWQSRNNDKTAIAYLCVVVKSNMDEWTEIARNVEYNRIKYNEYMSEYVAAGANMRATEKQSHEQRLCAQTLLRPVTQFDLWYRNQHIATNGRVRSGKDYKFTLDDILSRVAFTNNSQASTEYQRSLVTPKVRSRILKRDGYKCTQCGRTADDGMKLVVDHIVPVSKGGETKDSNLQTLCFECDKGKGNK